MKTLIVWLAAMVIGMACWWLGYDRLAAIATIGIVVIFAVVPEFFKEYDHNQRLRIRQELEKYHQRKHDD
jgi:membrane protein YdbS with pleckstrin-like domain